MERSIQKLFLKFSIDYVSRLWGISKQDPWPEQVLL